MKTVDGENEVAEAILELAKSTRAIAHGGLEAPGGLEGVCVFIRDHVQPSLDAIAQSNSEIADALNNIANAILKQKK